MAKKLTPFRRKQIPSPVTAIRTPAMDGPMSLAPLNRKEFSAMAFPRSSFRSSISTKKDCRTGMSKEYTKPRNKLKAMMCQTSAIPVSVRKARTKDWTMARVWGAISRW